MAVKIEYLPQSGSKMDREDIHAAKLCLLSTGALMGLAVKGHFPRRLATVACSALTAGLAIPLAVKQLEQREKDLLAEPLEGKE